MSARLAISAWSELFYLDMVGLRGFKAVQRCVSRTKRRTNASGPAPPSAIPAIVEAMEAACALYFKQPQCLQRSAVVTRMLRRRGIEAEMVIGCHLPPLKAHAWVEVAGDVVSDYQDNLEHFRVLDRW